MNHPELYPASGCLLLHFPKETASAGGIIIPATARKRETGIGTIVRAGLNFDENLRPGVKVVITGDAIIDYVAGTDHEYAFVKCSDVVGYDAREAAA